jgi:hypothetical protein
MSRVERDRLLPRADRPVQISLLEPGRELADRLRRIRGNGQQQREKDVRGQNSHLAILRSRVGPPRGSEPSLLAAQSGHRIDSHDPPSWEIRRQRARGGQQQSRDEDRR